MTVVTSAPGQSFSLFVTLDVTRGSAVSQGEIELLDGMLDSDILTQILLNERGAANLTYRAAATVGQGSSMDEGDDVHTITYTILAQ